MKIIKQTNNDGYKVISNFKNKGIKKIMDNISIRLRTDVMTAIIFEGGENILNVLSPAFEIIHSITNISDIYD